jgi:hypothetical protein
MTRFKAEHTEKVVGVAINPGDAISDKEQYKRNDCDDDRCDDNPYIT